MFCALQYTTKRPSAAALPVAVKPASKMVESAAVVVFLIVYSLLSLWLIQGSPYYK